MAALLCGHGIPDNDNACEKPIAICQECGNCCQRIGKFWKRCGKAICSPFFPYLAASAVLNVPPVIWSAQSFHVTCTLSWWLWINGFLSLAHILASNYVVFQLQNPGEKEAAVDSEAGVHEVRSHYQKMDAKDMKQSIQHMRKSYRLGRILCYDPVVSVYLFFSFLWIMWQTLGMFVIYQVGGDFDDDECHTKTRIFFSIFTGWIYAMLLILMSLCFALRGYQRFKKRQTDESNLKRKTTDKTVAPSFDSDDDLDRLMSATLESI